MSEDFEWFLNHFSELYKKYGDSYLVIKNKQVIGVYHSYSEAVYSTKKEEPLGTFIVQKCGCDETAYTNYISSVNIVSGLNGGEHVCK